MPTTISDDIPPERYDDTIYANYVEFGGKIDRERFDKILPIFLFYTASSFADDGDIDENIIVEAELRGVAYRVVAFELWVRFIKKIGDTEQDANRIFRAMDAFGGYS